MYLLRFVIEIAARRLRGPGGGPWYLETGRHVGSVIREPWNAASCLLFLILAAFWFIRLRGQYKRHAFLTACLGLVAVGGVGGTVYHAFRAHPVWLYMDFMPIFALCFAVAIYLWSRLLRRWWWVLLTVPAVFVFLILNFRVFFPHLIRWAIVITYSLMVVLIALPAVGVLYRTRFRFGVFLLLAAVFFVLAITARTTDKYWPGVFAMGTHWLWHVFGAAAGHMVGEYLYRLPRALEPRAAG
ncbi:MAG: hypothetical protein ACYTF6_12385 [Planctomycetota bacterium]|jgi:hemolysin III